MDYLDDQNAYLVSIKGVEKVPPEYGNWFLFDSTGKWSIPDEQGLRLSLHEVFEEREKAELKGLFGAQMAKHYDWDNITLKYRECLENSKDIDKYFAKLVKIDFKGEDVHEKL